MVNWRSQFDRSYWFTHELGPVSKQMKHLTIWYDCAWHMVWCEGQVNLFLHHDLLLLLSSVR